MKAKETKYNQGGVLRCCINTMANKMMEDREKEYKDGDVIECAAGGEGCGMKLYNGIWFGMICFNEKGEFVARK